jgi:hypothetical protein
VDGESNQEHEEGEERDFTYSKIQIAKNEASTASNEKVHHV